MALEKLVCQSNLSTVYTAHVAQQIAQLDRHHALPVVATAGSVLASVHPSAGVLFTSSP